MQGRTWKKIEPSLTNEVKKYLIDNGGNEEDVKSPHEDWRVKFSDSTFTFYHKGTLYCTPSKSGDPAITEAWAQIDSIVGEAYVLPSKDFTIGLDETGKGEIIGHTILSGVIIPKEIYKNLDMLIGPADTKKRHDLKYWDELFKQIDKFRGRGLDFNLEKITPWHVDKYNLNKIMDISYQRILSILFRKIDISRCRIVLDDYGVGDILKRFLNFLGKQGAEVIVTSGSEDQYLEAKVASLIAKRDREIIMQAINKKKEFQIDSVSVGSGNAGDSRTIEWLKKWHALDKPWPWFVKRSFKTIKEIEDRAIKTIKVTPPIKNELLSNEFIDNFNKGKLSIQSLSLNCPHCGVKLKGVAFVMLNEGGRKKSLLKCQDCDKFIDNSNITLRYYCGYVIPDSSAIQRSMLSKDLSTAKFFENFTVLLVPVVRKECDGPPRGKREFEELSKFNSIGIIKLESPGKVQEVPDGMSNTVRDEYIIEACVKHNAILLTADNSMKSFAGGKDVFTISI